MERAIQAAEAIKVVNQLPLEKEMILDHPLGPMQSQEPKSAKGRKH